MSSPASTKSRPVNGILGRGSGLKRCLTWPCVVFRLEAQQKAGEHDLGVPTHVVPVLKLLAADVNMGATYRALQLRPEPSIELTWVSPRTHSSAEWLTASWR